MDSIGRRSFIRRLAGYVGVVTASPMLAKLAGAQGIAEEEKEIGTLLGIPIVENPDLAELDGEIVLSDGGYLVLEEYIGEIISAFEDVGIPCRGMKKRDFFKAEARR